MFSNQFGDGREPVEDGRRKDGQDDGRRQSEKPADAGEEKEPAEGQVAKPIEEIESDTLGLGTDAIQPAADDALIQSKIEHLQREQDAHSEISATKDPVKTGEQATAPAADEKPAESGSPTRSSSGSGSSESKKANFVPKSRPNSGDDPVVGGLDELLDESKEEKSKEETATLNSPTPSGEGQNELEATKEDDADTPGVDSRCQISTRLLNLCKKGEWIAADNILRYTDRKKLDLTMTDDHGFTPLLFAIKDGR